MYMLIRIQVRLILIMTGVNVFATFGRYQLVIKFGIDSWKHVYCVNNERGVIRISGEKLFCPNFKTTTPFKNEIFYQIEK